jgi:endoglucanase
MTGPRRIAYLAAIAATCALGAAAAGLASRDHSSPGDPLAHLRFSVDPQTPAAAQAKAYRAARDRADAALMRQIAGRPTAAWLGGTAPEARRRAAGLTRRAARAGAAPIMVLYAIPSRDCGGASGGGAATADQYRAWVHAVASGIGRRRAVVIVEPDATAHIASGCLPAAAATEREALLAYAIADLKSRTRATVYLDGGNAGWTAAREMAPVLQRAGIRRADGFSVNVGNFYTTAQSRRYGDTLSRRLGGTHFVIDTSRNGNGPYTGPLTPQWCNPPGRALGAAPTTRTGDRSVDALLWVKYPGASDGSCRPGEPPAGAWWPEYALGLVRASRGPR